MELPSYLESSLRRGESERLELKSSIHEPLLLAKLIASFANASGGNILVGVSEVPPQVKGVNRKHIERLFQIAISRIEPPANA
jgi:predicted HTH transcriptional regulator